MARTSETTAAPNVKTNVGLVEFCETKLGLPYFYGAKMEVVTEGLYKTLTGMYPSMIPASDRAKIGKVCCDCSGLISAYTGVTRGSSQHRQASGETRPINTVAQAPAGALVWKEGHIGVYVGMENGTPMYIAEDGSALGCRKARLPGVFTEWFLCGDVVYMKEEKKEPGREEVLRAIEELARRGIMQSPEYWVENYVKLEFLGRLIVNMAGANG